MKKWILLVVAVLAVLGSVATAQEQVETPALKTTLDVSYVSRYMWRGYDAYANDHSAIQPSLDIDLFDSGFGVNIWMSRANGGGFENAEWLDYTLYYNDMLYPDQDYATYYKVGYTYYSYPDEPRKGTTDNAGSTGAAQEVFAAFAWPKICPMGIVPSYVVVCYWPSESGAANQDNGGWAHVVGLGYDFTIPGILADTTEQTIHLSAEAIYNDSVGPAGKTADSDWSHAVFGASTKFPINDNLTFVPGIYYQSSWDDSINTSDEYWTKLSLVYEF